MFILLIFENLFKLHYYSIIFGFSQNKMAPIVDAIKYWLRFLILSQYLGLTYENLVANSVSNIVMVAEQVGVGPQLTFIEESCIHMEASSSSRPCWLCGRDV